MVPYDGILLANGWMRSDCSCCLLIVADQRCGGEFLIEFSFFCWDYSVLTFRGHFCEGINRILGGASSLLMDTGTTTQVVQ